MPLSICCWPHASVPKGIAPVSNPSQKSAIHPCRVRGRRAPNARITAQQMGAAINVRAAATVSGGISATAMVRNRKVLPRSSAAASRRPQSAAFIGRFMVSVSSKETPYCLRIASKLALTLALCKEFQGRYARQMIYEPNQCPVRFGLGVFGDRWTLLIIRDMMFRGFTRFQDFLNAGEGISTNVLSDRLRRLEARQIVSRKKRRPTGARSYTN